MPNEELIELLDDIDEARANVEAMDFSGISPMGVMTGKLDVEKLALPLLKLCATYDAALRQLLSIEIERSELNFD